MLHFVIGTKAQFIKMSPLMWLLKQRAIPYHLLDLSQHAALTATTLKDFDLSPPTTRYLSEQTLIHTYRQAFTWAAGLGIEVLGSPRRVLDRWFLGQPGIALVHGDTASTLLGSLLAWRAKLPIALVEAGLTSGRILDPFPEELIRKLVQRMATYCFCPGPLETAHLRQSGRACQIHDTGYNTGEDALKLALQMPVREPVDGEYAVATLHRLETLSSSTRLARAINHIRAMAGTLGHVRFYMHPPTRNALEREGLMETLTSSPVISVHALLPYVDFAHVLAGARCIITDGGSIQEEAASLRKRCVILRNVTERNAGIGINARLTEWDPHSDVSFLHAVPVDPVSTVDHFRASREVLDVLTGFGRI